MTRIKWVPCHYGMTCPQITDGGNGIQTWKVAVNILNKQLRSTNRGWFPSLGIRRIKNSSTQQKKLACYGMFHGALMCKVINFPVP